MEFSIIKNTSAIRDEKPITKIIRFRQSNSAYLVINTVIITIDARCDYYTQTHTVYAIIE